VVRAGAAAWIAGTTASNTGPTTSTVASASRTISPISAGVNRKFSGAIAAPIFAAPSETSKNSGLLRSR
jgi:hypothetical protein